MAGFARAAGTGVALASLAGSAHAQAQVTDPTVLPFEAGRLGIPSATIGSPDRAGLYLFFVHYARGMRSSLHVHRDDRMLTVLRGTLYLGEGPDPLDASSAQPIQPGSSILIRAGTPHFGWAKDSEVLTQEIGTGPTSTTVVGETK